MKLEYVKGKYLPEIEKIKDTDNWIDSHSDFITSFDKLFKAGNALGLSANQLYDKDTGNMFDYRVCMIKDNNTYIMAINPKILNHSEEPSIRSEGCMLWTMRQAVIAQRYESITVSYTDAMTKQPTMLVADGICAQAWQHCLDHLDGIEECVVNLTLDEEDIKAVKPGRNDQCLCNSGKKYKNCCLNSDQNCK